MNKKILILGGVIILIIFTFYYNIEYPKKDVSKNNSITGNVQLENSKEIRYFKQTDKIILNILNETLYTDNLNTKINYSAIDESGNLVHFKESDRVFVRILGITRLYNDNIEIFHPNSNNTIFSGNISFPGKGVYLVKACIGPKINLAKDGSKIWPFGCFEDRTAIQINIYEKE